MDSVNPDYLAAWIFRGSNNIPAWLYPDNYLFDLYRFPLLNSFYGSNITAYMGALFFHIAGYGLAEVRIFHVLLGLIVLISLFWCLNKWKIPHIVNTAVLCLISIDPNFIFAWRTQYYLQLVPTIFLFFGLGIIGKHYQKITSFIVMRKFLFIAGVFLGFSAYLYFIFAFYAIVIIIAYYLLIDKKLSLHDTAYLIVGAIIGWLPFIYAHASIILNTSFHAYLEQLHGLQTAYGVVDCNQGWFIERAFIVLQRLGYLIGGNSIQTVMFGNWKIGGASIAHALILIMGPITCLISLNSKNSKNNTNIITQILFIKLLFAIFCAHFVIGCIIGRPLGLQHYIMLLPILYAMSAVGLANLLQNINLRLRLRRLKFGAIFILLLGLFISNYSLSLGIMERLKQTGGVGMYSDAINIAAVSISKLSPDTVLLFPQWGYWMGVVTILGPRFSVYEAPSLDDMKEKLSHDTNLLKHKSFALIIGNDSLKENPRYVLKRVKEFAKAINLYITNITRCRGRNNSDQLFLIQMMRA